MRLRIGFDNVDDGTVDDIGHVILYVKNDDNLEKVMALLDECGYNTTIYGMNAVKCEIDCCLDEADWHLAITSELFELINWDSSLIVRRVEYSFGKPLLAEAKADLVLETLGETGNEKLGEYFRHKFGASH